MAVNGFLSSSVVIKTMKRFTITLIHYHWSCGDGCCSDSGYKVYVTDKQPKKAGYNIVYENTEWDYNRNSDSLLEMALERIQDKLGRPVVKSDYRVVEGDEYSD